MRARAWMKGKGSCVLTVSLLLSLLLWPAQSAAQSANTTFSGQATVVRATVAGITTVISDTGPLPSSGGAQEATLLTANAPGLLTAEALHASTVGQEQHSRAEASVANLNLTVGGNTISADFLMAKATATCDNNGGSSVSGSSDITNLVVNGQPIGVSGTPNQTVQVGPVTVIINEQTSSTNGRNDDITVNALHVVVNGVAGVNPVADVVISSAHADIHCGGPVCPGGDFVTGGGWITGTPSGAKGNFGVAGGMKNGALWGHLTYIDHGLNGPKVKGTGVTAYKVVNPTSRHIDGTAEVSGQGGFTYHVDVSDNGEPGHNDTFTILLSNGYYASGLLAGGNIKLHSPCK